MLALIAVAALLPFQAVEAHMGTLFQIRLYAPDAQTADAAFRAAFDRVRRLDETLSDYLPGSELNRLCRAPAGTAVPVSDDLFRVLAASQELAKRSHGAFDITVGRLTRIWREARKQGRMPDPAAIEDALAHTGYSHLHLDQRRRTARLDMAGIQLDAGAIGKGDAADQALDAITRMGIRSALVAASGDLAFSDPPPGQRGWKIGLDDGSRELSNCAVSTSGDSEQHLDFGGRRYSHIIDPRTGQGLTGNARVTVIAPRGIVSDGLSTAISVLGARRGARLAKKYSGAWATVS